VAKILVADDNSNVQKTVGLALADLGIEVIAVNNGDAAVRKLGDIMPDLVLADIFMPVRNGYEVCDYVKKDSRFAHIPVVLLVGAFDPLDEREAQRVGSDGILKKPFVPPDPLIAMVKALLERTAGDRLVAVGASKPAAAIQSGASEVKVAQQRPAPVVTPEEAPEEEVQPHVAPVSFGEGEHPVAFGQLLDGALKNSAETETAAVEPVDDEQVLTGSRDAALGDPIFWRSDEPEPETEEANAESEKEDPADFTSRAWKLDEDSVPGGAGTDLVQPVEPFELVRDQQDDGETPTVVEKSPIMVQDAASQAALTVEAGRAADLAANPIDWMASASASHVEETPEANVPWSAEDSETIEAREIEDAKQEFSVQQAPEPMAPRPPASAVIPTAAKPPAPAPPPAPPAPPQAKIAAPIPEPQKAPPSFKVPTQSAEDTARSIPTHDWADLAASLQAKPVEPVAEKPKPVPVAAAPAPPPTPVSSPAAPVESTIPGAPDPALVEAVVQRVLDKMKPQVVDIITKEFLRPVVQALVHREIQKH
jgi:CheY-like chemotaxis protein